MSKQGIPKRLEKEDVLYRGKLFEIVRNYWKTDRGILSRELAIRPPGVRVLLKNKGKILIQKEYRREYEDWDYRLPGGKVFDTLDEYRNAGGNIVKHAELAAKKELLEETGFTPNKLKYLCKTTAGATVEWDIHYFEAEGIASKTRKTPEPGEIMRTQWKTPKQVLEMCIDGSIRESGTVGVLLKYLYSNRLILTFPPSIIA